MSSADLWMWILFVNMPVIAIAVRYWLARRVDSSRRRSGGSAHFGMYHTEGGNSGCDYGASGGDFGGGGHCGGGF